MPTITIDLEPGEIVTVTVTSSELDFLDEPPPGEEIPEEERKPQIKAVGQ